MSLIYERPEAVSLSLGRKIDPSRWTAIIPAAGRGSRLGFHLPKLLYPILGRTVASHLIGILSPYCSRFVFVVSPSGYSPIAEELKKMSVSCEIVVQDEPLGMADAVLRADGAVATPNSLVVWGDQISIRAETVRLSMDHHEGRSTAVATVPTTMARNPYIHFERDEAGRLLRVLQARERSISLDWGESDGGMFLFRTGSLFEELKRCQKNGQARGETTGEFNLLQVLPYLDDGGDAFCTLRILSEDETLGINTIEDAEKVEKILARR